MGILDQFRLDGKVAIVTGGAKGLGRVIAEALASAGASVVITSRDESTSQEGAREIAASTGGKTLGLALEVTSREDVREKIARTLDVFDKIHILVNNAGINIRGPIEKLSESDWDAVIDTNLKGPWLCCQAVAETMKAQRWGRVINLASMLGEISLPDRTPYATSKGGLILMTKTLALEWAKHGINVNALCPGPFLTEINRPLLNDPVARQTMESKIPLGRWGEPAELGASAVFLASEASSFVTGSSLFIDGGYTAQ